MRGTVLLGLGLVLAMAGPAAGNGAETRRLLRVVRTETAPEAWTRAVTALKTGTPDQRAQVAEELLRLARERHRTWVKTADKVGALLTRLGDGKRSAKKRRDWEEAKDYANEWIFDEERFPVPVQTVITGPQEGYGPAKRRGDRAVGAWSALRPALDRALKRALALSPKKARRLQEEWQHGARAFELVASQLDAPALAGLEAPMVDPLAALLLELRQGAFARAAKAYGETAPGWRRLCLFHAYSRSLLDWNAAHPFEMDKSALHGIGALNAYRIALGISPVAHNEKLARTARGHSTEMTKSGYFSHRSPVAGRETKEKRAALEGYAAKVVECITGVGGGSAAVEFWKYDGGHHRDMIRPKWVEGGMSTRGPAVYNGGQGEPGHTPGIRY